MKAEVPFLMCHIGFRWLKARLGRCRVNNNQRSIRAGLRGIGTAGPWGVCVCVCGGESGTDIHTLSNMFCMDLKSSSSIKIIPQLLSSAHLYIKQDLVQALRMTCAQINWGRRNLFCRKMNNSTRLTLKWGTWRGFFLYLELACSYISSSESIIPP